MKRLTFSFLLSMFLYGTAISQFSMLFEGGANYGKATISENILIDHDNITSYYLAATPKFGITDKLKVIGEIQYSVEGAVTKGFFTSAVDGLSYRQHYLRIVPGLQFKIIGPLSMVCGVNVGYVALETIEDFNGNQVGSGLSRLQKESDVGALVGLNLNISGINIIAKYNYGLRNLNDIPFTDKEGLLLDDITIKSRFLQVGVGYEFGL